MQHDFQNVQIVHLFHRFIFKAIDFLQKPSQMKLKNWLINQKSSIVPEKFPNKGKTISVRFINKVMHKQPDIKDLLLLKFLVFKDQHG